MDWGLTMEERGQPAQVVLDSAVAGMKSCIQELQIWLCSHFLKCSDKTEVWVIGLRSQTAKVHISHVIGWR